MPPSGGRGRYRRAYGQERAIEHIREAEKLSRELGGTDKDVKKYLFSLRGRKLRDTLDAYEKRYGRSPRQYAEQALPQWRSGRRKMSGLVAGRLYALLPPRMDLREKYRLVESLWRKFGPSSHKVIRIGPDVPAEDIVAQARKQILETVEGYRVPEPLSNRFEWLAEHDVDTYQQLLNHFLELEKEQAVKGTAEQVPVMLEHLKNRGEHTHRLAQSIIIGNHRIDLEYATQGHGLRVAAPDELRVESRGGGGGWGLFAIVALVILFLLALADRV